MDRLAVYEMALAQVQQQGLYEVEVMYEVWVRSGGFFLGEDGSLSVSESGGGNILLEF